MEVKKGKEYQIPFTGLKDGIHEFHYQLDKSFFDLVEYSEILDADLEVNLKLEKKPNMMIVEFEMAGKVKVSCDRCTEDMMLSISGSDDVIYKFGEGFSEDEKIILIDPNDVEIDVKHPLYEFSILQLPAKKIHPEGECNQEMIDALDNYLMVDEKEVENQVNDDDDSDEDIDPRWNALKDLK